MRKNKVLKKKASCLHSIEVGLLVKLNKGKINFASNHGTMPRRYVGVFKFETVRLAKLGKNNLAKPSNFAIQSAI